MMKAASHLNGCPWQDDTKVGSQLLDGFWKFGFPIFDDMTLIKDAVIKFYVSEKIKDLFNTEQKTQNKKKQKPFIEIGIKLT